MSQVLQMVFKTGEGKSFRITLDDPNADISSEDIQGAVDTILAVDPFNVEGGLVSIAEANIITTQTDAIELI